MVAGYNRENLDNGEIRVTADGGLNQVLPFIEKPYMIIYVAKNKNFHVVKTLDDIGEDYELQEVVQ